MPFDNMTLPDTENFSAAKDLLTLALSGMGVFGGDQASSIFSGFGSGSFPQSATNTDKSIFAGSGAGNVFSAIDDIMTIRNTDPANGNAANTVTTATTATSQIENLVSSHEKIDWLAYVASYPDLIAAFGVDADAASQHYSQTGKNEGRTITFDGLKYIASYPDLIAAFGNDADAGIRHYIQFGKNEGRLPSFDAGAYLAKYEDLRSAFGEDVNAALQHYLTIGAKENRSARSPSHETGSGMNDAAQSSGGAAEIVLVGMAGFLTLADEPAG